MKFKIYYFDEFYTELEAIHIYISQYSPKNADNLIALIRQALNIAMENPMAFGVARESADFPDLDLRQVVCKNHRIVYWISGNKVFVLAALSCRQDHMSFERIIAP